MMPRPSVSDPEFAAYFENIVETSKTRREAMNRLGYKYPNNNLSSPEEAWHSSA